MTKGTGKVRVGFYVEKEILEMADGLLAEANVRSRGYPEDPACAVQLFCQQAEDRGEDQ